MQSGITVSPDLHDAFTAFTSSSSSQTQFALPITITGESLTAQKPVPWPSGSGSDLKSALPSLSAHLQPKTPIYLLLRKSREPSSALVAITYVPSTAPVRSKTLFAATRATLVRELGLEKFSDTIFVTDAEEVLDPRQWSEREGGKNGAAGEQNDTGLLSAEERELQAVKRAEDEERHGTAGRDLMGDGGSGISGGTSAHQYGRVSMNVADDARAAVASLTSGNGENGNLAQLGIDVPSETIVLVSAAQDVALKEVSSKIPTDRPTYNFYHFPSTKTTVFIYVCPGASKVKERMLYATSRRAVLDLAQNEDVDYIKKIETGEPDEITEERLTDEVGVKKAEEDSTTSRQGFARPKRPGKR